MASKRQRKKKQNRDDKNTVQNIVIGKQKPKPEVLRELSLSAKRDRSIYMGILDRMKNPDRVLNNTEEGIRKQYDLYEEMCNDPHIKAELQIRLLKVSSLPFIIDPNSTEVKDIEQALELKKQLENIYRPMVREIQDAIRKGFSVTELGWEKQPDGKVGLEWVEGLLQKKIAFDEHWNMFLCSDDFGSEKEPIPPERAVLASFDMRNANRFGNSLLTACFWPYWMKKHAMLFWSIFLEKFGQPTAVGKYPAGTNKEGQDLLLEALESIQNDYAVIFPDRYTAEFLEASRAGNVTYEKFIEFQDNYISKVLLLTTLASNEAQFGTRAQAQVHQDITDEVIEDDALWLADILTRQVVRPLALWNYTFSVPPTLKIQCRSKGVNKEAAEKDLIVSEIAPVPVEHTWEKYHITPPEDDSLVVFKGNLYFWQDGKPVPLEAPAAPSPDEKGKPLPPAHVVGEFAEGDNAGGDDFDKLLEQESDFIDSLYLFNRESLRACGETAARKLNKLLKKSGDYDKALEKIEAFKGGRSKNFWTEMFTLARLLGEYSVAVQIESIEAAAEFEEGSGQLLNADAEAYRKLIPKKAIKWLRDRIAVTGEVWRQIENDARMAAFYVSGLEREDLIQFVKEQMIEALAEGKPYRQFAKEMFQLTGAAPFFGSMKTSFQTNMFTALSVQNEIGLNRVTDRFPHWRYSCIMDGKERQSHREMHNFVARYDDPIWNTWTPPCGFNCRCRKCICTRARYEKLRPASEQLDVPAVDPGFDHNPLGQNFKTLRELLEKRRQEGVELSGRVRSEYGDYLKRLKKIRERKDG